MIVPRSREPLYLKDASLFSPPLRGKEKSPLSIRDHETPEGRCGMRIVTHIDSRGEFTNPTRPASDAGNANR